MTKQLTFHNSTRELSPLDYITYLKENIDNSTDKIVAKIEKSAAQQKEIIGQGLQCLNQGLSAVNQQQINTNILLQDIAELLRLPDSEKQRQLQIERGLKFSTQALRDKDIAVDALNEFEAALKLMPQDWFVLHQAGMMTLFHEKTLDIQASKNYFLKAAKYAAVEQSKDGNIYINTLFRKEFDLSFEDQFDKIELCSFLREAYLNAALCAYISSEFADAASMAEKALDLNPKNVKALFFAAKYQARNKNSDRAFYLTTLCLDNAPYMFEAVQAEKDLIIIPQLQSHLERLKEEYNHEVSIMLEKIKTVESYINRRIENVSDNETIYYENPVAAWKLRKSELASGKIADFKNRDTLFEECGRTVVQMQSGSTTDLQRKYNLGHNRAGRIMDQLEAAYIVGQAMGSKPREVLIKTEEEYDKLVKSGVSFYVDYPLIGYKAEDLLNRWDEIETKCKEYKTRLENPSFQQPLSTDDNSKQPCFIATATLGTDNHFILSDLRGFRNSFLAKSPIGRAFILWYYKHGPKAAKFISTNAWLRPIFYVLLIKPLHIIVKAFFLEKKI